MGALLAKSKDIRARRRGGGNATLDFEGLALDVQALILLYLDATEVVILSRLCKSITSAVEKSLSMERIVYEPGISIKGDVRSDWFVSMFRRCSRVLRLEQRFEKRWMPTDRVVVRELAHAREKCFEKRWMPTDSVVVWELAHSCELPKLEWDWLALQTQKTLGYKLITRMNMQSVNFREVCLQFHPSNLVELSNAGFPPCPRATLLSISTQYVPDKLPDLSSFHTVKTFNFHTWGNSKSENVVALARSGLPPNIEYLSLVVSTPWQAIVAEVLSRAHVLKGVCVARDTLRASRERAPPPDQAFALISSFPHLKDMWFHLNYPCAVPLKAMLQSAVTGSSIRQIEDRHGENSPPSVRPPYESLMNVNFVLDHSLVDDVSELLPEFISLMPNLRCLTVESSSSNDSPERTWESFRHDALSAHVIPASVAAANVSTLRSLALEGFYLSPSIAEGIGRLSSLTHLKLSNFVNDASLQPTQFVDALSPTLTSIQLTWDLRCPLPDKCHEPADWLAFLRTLIGILRPLLARSDTSSRSDTRSSSDNHSRSNASVCFVEASLRVVNNRAAHLRPTEHRTLTRALRADLCTVSELFRTSRVRSWLVGFPIPFVDDHGVKRHGFYSSVSPDGEDEICWGDTSPYRAVKLC